MARKTGTQTTQTTQTGHTRSRSPRSRGVSAPRVSHFPVPISPEALRGPTPTPKRIIIQDYFGPGQPGSLHYLPTPVSGMIEMMEYDSLPELARKMIDRLSVSIVTPDGAPLMTKEQWGELDFQRLLWISDQISSAIRGERGDKSGADEKQDEAGSGHVSGNA